MKQADYVLLDIAVNINHRITDLNAYSMRIALLKVQVDLATRVHRRVAGFVVGKVGKIAELQLCNSRVEETADIRTRNCLGI
jgi:hypothetical protein